MNFHKFQGQPILKKAKFGFLASKRPNLATLGWGGPRRMSFNFGKFFFFLGGGVADRILVIKHVEISVYHVPLVHNDMYVCQPFPTRSVLKRFHFSSCQSYENNAFWKKMLH